MLTVDDYVLIRQYDESLQIVRDRTRGVAEGWSTGFYLWGEGGIGKSYAVIEELEALKMSYKLTNSRLSGKGLFDLLAQHPDMIHVLEDMELLVKDHNASGVLRSALWSQSKGDKQHVERPITWVTGWKKMQAVFTGGIILTMNAPLDDYPELRAIKTRIAHLHLEPSQKQLEAKMREIASKGYQHGKHKLNPDECFEVCAFLLTKFKEAGQNLDIRTLINCFDDRLQDREGHSETHWQDMIESRLKERVLTTITRAGTIADEQKIAVEISKMKIPLDAKMKLWFDRTGKGRAAYYRRLGGK